MLNKECKNILVFAETKATHISENSLELLGEAQRLKKQLNNGSMVLAALIGNNVSDFLPELYRHGAEVVITCNHNCLKMYRSDFYGEALTQIIEKYAPEIVLIGASYLGAELAPTVAAKLKTGLAAHCTELRIDENGGLVQVVPAFGGKVLGDIVTPRHRPQMATVKAGITQKTVFPENTGKLEEFFYNPVGYGDRIVVKGIINDLAKRKPLHESECIVGGGFGIGSKENWAILEELAALLKGATGCTRPALDEGWTEGEQTMIGTSGVAVRPNVYINAGISGAAHHTCGIKDAGLIISINKDANAMIFDYSDIKIVSDWKVILTALIEKLKNVK